MKRVLIAPLDWGLGHATRCIPVIQWLVDRKVDVHIAGNGPSLDLLALEFPSIPRWELPGYNPRYPQSNGMAIAMALQIPKFIKVISREHKIVEQLVEQHKIDIVISDNRFGCRTSLARCIFITHQSNILMPQRFGWLGKLVKWMNERYIRKFDTCWIPDYPHGTLAGSLISFGKNNFHPDVRYVGPLSRFNAAPDNDAPQYDIVAVCSGPEPQRTKFERILHEQLKHSAMRFLLIRGVFAESETPLEAPDVLNYLTTADLQKALKGASIVVARSGFSTVMDLAVLGKKAIFVPTPGQTEQEYLAKKMMSEKIAFSMEQKHFDLIKAMAESSAYTGFSAVTPDGNLEKVLTELMADEGFH